MSDPSPPSHCERPRKGAVARRRRRARAPKVTNSLTGSSKEQCHYPINDLPTEILVVIFLHCLPYIDVDENPWSHRWHDHYIRSDTITAIFHLSRTCRRWREIAISTPMFWSFLTLNYPFHNRVPDSVIRTWLERSQDMHLSVCVVALSYSDELYRALKVLLAHVCRWRRVKVYFPKAGTKSFYDKLIHQGDAPALEEARVSVSGNEAAEWWGALFKTAPRLHRVAWSGRPEVFLWTQLTYLKFHTGISPKQCVHILACAPLLVKSEFSLQRPIGPLFPPSHIFLLAIGHHVVHNRLESLAVYGNASSISEFFTYMTLPRLNELEMCGVTLSPISPWPQDDLLGFIDRSSCSLTRLRLKNAHISEAELLVWLRNERLCSMLKELSVCQYGYSASVSDDLLCALTANKRLKTSDSEFDIDNEEEEELLLPCLEFVQFRRCMEQFTNGFFASMIQSRYPGKGKTVPLNRVDVHLLSCYAKDIRWLERLKISGLNLRMTIEHGFSDEGEPFEREGDDDSEW